MAKDMATIAAPEASRTYRPAPGGHDVPHRKQV